MPWRVESHEGGSGARRGVGDSGGVWEVLAVVARGRDTPEPPPCIPHRAESSGSQGSKLRGQVRSRLNEPLYPLWVHFKCLE